MCHPAILWVGAEIPPLGAGGFAADALGIEPVHPRQGANRGAGGATVSPVGDDRAEGRILGVISRQPVRAFPWPDILPPHAPGRLLLRKPGLPLANCAAWLVVVLAVPDQDALELRF